MIRQRAWAVGVAALAASLGVFPGESRADRIVLRGGTQVRGKVVNDPKTPGRVTVVLERGKTPMTVPKDRIVEVIEEPGPLDGYVVRRAAAAMSAQGQFDLGSYCEQHRLPDLAELHYEAALKLDKGFAPAHEKLGHALIRGRWLSGDELREAQGLVRFKGKWVTREVKEEREKSNESAAERSSWARRIRLWRDAIAQGSDDRRREAEAQLLAIRDPAAVAPLVRVLGADPPPLRSLLAKVLAGIPGAEASSALVQRLVEEDDAEARDAVMEAIRSREKSEVIKPLSRALKSTDPAVVNRAAWGLGNLNAVEAVPALVGSLVTTRTRMVMGQSSGPAGGAGITAAFNSGPAGGGLNLGPGAGTVPIANGGPFAPIAYNGSSIGYLTGPIVGPGVAAFGAVSVPAFPYSINPMPAVPTLPSLNAGAALAGTGINAGGGLGGSRGPVPRMVTDTFQNTEVLAALVKLTREDFGYNVNTWRRWLRTAFQPDPAPARSVPQP